MAENIAVATVYLSGTGLPRAWLARLSRELVADHFAASATIYERRDPDNGVGVLAQLHTRADLIDQIRRRASIADVRAYPLQCSPDYASWVLAETSR
ncbi:hypothetical protein IU431_06645 [Nocardia otitidiscaviarum]|uniref:hypothetical protein n=1 Tax=Nocardia otitidiscaviarum TaxID=1823 RepID=UPI0004A7270F|nr:hypothetical protein [Nocardia otitidiscaviarum]MBF6483835.1 hypothetical protein [Nocardia otitidiscaviarum]